MGYVGYTTWLSLVIPWVRCQVLDTVIREMGCSVRGPDSTAGSLICWVFSWWRCPREASLFRSWCVQAAPKADGAGFALDPIKATRLLQGFRLVGLFISGHATNSMAEPQHAPDSLQYYHHLAEVFSVVFLILTVLLPLWLCSRCSSGLLWFPCLGEITVLSFFEVHKYGEQSWGTL